MADTFKLSKTGAEIEEIIAQSESHITASEAETIADTKCRDIAYTKAETDSAIGDAESNANTYSDSKLTEALSDYYDKGEVVEYVSDRTREVIYVLESGYLYDPKTNTEYPMSALLSRIAIDDLAHSCKFVLYDCEHKSETDVNCSTNGMGDYISLTYIDNAYNLVCGNYDATGIDIIEWTYAPPPKSSIDTFGVAKAGQYIIAEDGVLSVDRDSLQNDYVLINSITTTEEVFKVELTADSQGTPYDLDSVIAKIHTPAASIKTMALRVYGGYNDTIQMWAVTVYAVANTTERYTVMSIANLDGWFDSWYLSPMSARASVTGKMQSYYGICDIAARAIKKVAITADGTNMIPAGTEIQLYAKRNMI